MRDRNCRKCGEYIPLSTKFEGKRISLQTRKFCLKCSPRGKHNTSKHDPIKRVKEKGSRYSDWSQEAKRTSILSVYKRGLERKAKLIDMAGGGCIRCGYNKSNRALSFHHRDRTTKEFGISLNNLWSKKWEVLLEEFAKCDLLCMNCHAEVEDEKVVDDGNGLVFLVNQKYGTNF